MKNVIKKIAATAMAFSLLGTGTAVTKTISPKFDNTLVTAAACHAHGQFIYYQVEQEILYYPMVKYSSKNDTVPYRIGIINYNCTRCRECGKLLKTKKIKEIAYTKYMTPADAEKEVQKLRKDKTVSVILYERKRGSNDRIDKITDTLSNFL